MPTATGWKIRGLRLTVTWNEGNIDIFELARRRLDVSEGGQPEKR
jgi:hypothetical protein